MLLCAIVATLCLVSCSNENPAPTRKVEMRRPTPQKVKDFDKYTFIDAMGVKYTLTLKDNMSAILECQSGSDSTTHYGSWNSSYLDICGCYEIEFPRGDRPLMDFADDRSEREVLWLNKEGSFLYNDITSAKAKNPKLRLEVIKVE